MRNKNNIRVNTCSYIAWLGNKGGSDTSSLEEVGDVSSPYYMTPMSDGLYDIYERLEYIYYTGMLKGRQRQIVTLLLEGETNQSTIAKRLNMKQCNVSTELQKIKKKITEKII